ncbi:hypothetical protein CC117_27150 [Parafrankia colletiae]|uniref:Solute-binding protein family 5 domain-containing protein n=1 Tax=Parafrankia colletiae TaxID=573497 RepID=A0A1S1Q7W9_9ACTN|nr:hypothetical protein CC117_27150 [Parafrankia colletiae]
MSVPALAACGNGSDTPGGEPAAASADTGAPQSGGSITFGVANETSGLDPTVSAAVGAAGASELAAIYDVVLRYDPEKKTYENGTAQELTHNADYTEWTLRLKPGITFSDGTAYDADAVRQSIERHRAPKSRSLARDYVQMIDQMTVVDPLTLRFSLVSAWTGFPYLLTTQAGFITSPTAVQKLGEKLNTNPAGAGAGPFVLDSYTPKDSIVLTRNPNYWDGPVYLESLKFVHFQGGALTYEAFRSGQIQAGFLREAAASHDAGEAEEPGYVATLGAGDLLAINSAEGHPGHDRRVRQALAAAIDPKVLSTRVYDGKAVPSSSPFPGGFPWGPGVPGTTYDLAKATSLVAAAKADGWDGRIELLASSAPLAVKWALTVEALLEQAGFQVDVRQVDPSALTTAIFVNREFDIAQSAFGIPSSDGAFVQLQENIGHDDNRFGFHDDAFSAALAEVQVAETDAERTAAYRKLATAWNDSVPGVATASINSRVIWVSNLHDVRPTSQVAVLFGKAWLSR